MGQRPKRRRYKDNPYYLDYDDYKNTYHIKFEDAKKHAQIVEVNE